MTAGAMPGKYTLIFDGNCGVCQRSVKWIQEWDTAAEIECIPYQSPEVAERYPEFTEAALDAEMHLVAADGSVTKGARAVEEVVRIANRAPRIGWLFSLPGGRALARVGYRVFARNRHRFGCGDHCTISAHR